jgi:hypothetical protein
MEDEACSDRISVSIKEEVTAYGSQLLKKAVLSENSETLDAS